MANSGGSTSSSGPWWKSLTRKKSKEVTVGAQSHVQPEAEGHAPPYLDRTSSPREIQHSDVLGDTREPPKSDKLCEEKPCNSRRNLKISRSGRFKEKRKVRATLLPEGDRSPEDANFPEDPQEHK
ncbi:proline-rich protein 15 [Phodopus roborovskii]|uniref:Prr15 protein n=1 Tax=Phodopus roborovskii TaxID=109678 RepID=A0AAV0A3F9_PHORO|nr:proline-rich protein 15 [Phodopus roborovskii]CAH7149035.1 Prr15 [Phodopus roborovskii]